jgi:hypothetical protein
MTQPIKAIETRYKGYRFRSRLEARWAVFFDALGIEWQYEPQGYVLSDGACYLPDFYLPRFSDGLYVEVKPQAGDSEKARLLCQSTERSVLLAFGEPDTRAFDCWMCIADVGKANIAERVPVAFLDKYLPGSPRNGWENRLYWCAEEARYDDEAYVKGAVYAARGARFEHGECGLGAAR